MLLPSQRNGERVQAEPRQLCPMDCEPRLAPDSRWRLRSPEPRKATRPFRSPRVRAVSPVGPAGRGRLAPRRARQAAIFPVREPGRFGEPKRPQDRAERGRSVCGVDFAPAPPPRWKDGLISPRQSAPKAKLACGAAYSVSRPTSA